MIFSKASLPLDIPPTPIIGIVPKKISFDLKKNNKYNMYIISTYRADGPREADQGLPPETDYIVVHTFWGFFLPSIPFVSKYISFNVFVESALRGLPLKPPASFL